VFSPALRTKIPCGRRKTFIFADVPVEKLFTNICPVSEKIAMFPIGLSFSIINVMAIFYFTGHGCLIKGENYLLQGKRI
jgi:hypothetical protein